MGKAQRFLRFLMMMVVVAIGGILWHSAFSAGVADLKFDFQTGDGLNVWYDGADVCLPGFYWENGRCILCPDGYFCPGGDARSATKTKADEYDCYPFLRGYFGGMERPSILEDVDGWMRFGKVIGYGQIVPEGVAGTLYLASQCRLATTCAKAGEIRLPRAAECQCPEQNYYRVYYGDDGLYYDYLQDPKDACGDTTTTVTCAAGYYLTSAGSCTACTSGYYCPGGTFTSNGTVQGRNSCPSPFTSSAKASKANTSCYKPITLNKNGGTGSLTTNAGTYTGTSNATVYCYYSGTSSTSCTFPGVSGLTNTGYTYTGWGTTTSCTASTLTVNITTSTPSTYYACRTSATYQLIYQNNYCPMNNVYDWTDTSSSRSFTVRSQNDTFFGGNLPSVCNGPDVFVGWCGHSSWWVNPGEVYNIDLGGDLQAQYCNLATTSPGVIVEPAGYHIAFLADHGIFDQQCLDNGGCTDATEATRHGLCPSTSLSYQPKILARCDTGYKMKRSTDGNIIYDDGNIRVLSSCEPSLIECEPITTTVTFKSGNTTLGTQNFTYGTAQKLTNIGSFSAHEQLKSSGWEFYGWGTSAQTTTRTYTNEQSISNLTANVTLYAIWRRGINFKYYSSATATDVTTGTRYQYYYNAGAGAVSTYALYTQSSYGWKPLGWATSATENTVAVSQENATTKSITPAATSVAPTYYAVYSRDVNISYNGNTNTGGSTSNTSDTPQYYNAGGSAALAGIKFADNGFTKTGHSFSKWAAGSTSGTQYAAGAAYPNTAWNSVHNSSSNPLTMYAIWTANNYTITLDKNNTGSTDTGTGTTTLYTTYGTGVYNNSGRTNSMTTSANAVTVPVRKFTVTYDANGGTVGTASATATSTFGGYYSSESSNNGTGTQYVGNTGYITSTGLNVGKTLTANGTWYAKWTNGTVTLPTPSRSGYYFDGWYTAASGGTRVGGAGDSYTPTASVTLYGHWTACIKITLNNTTNGGTGGTTALYKRSGVAGWYSNTTCTTAVTTLTTAPTKTGATYLGHYTAATGGTQYITAARALNTTWAPTAATTLYAQYSDCIDGYSASGTSCVPNVYTITLDKQGGTGGTDKIYEKYWEGYSLTNFGTVVDWTSVQQPTKAGYTFGGYYSEPNCAGTQWWDGNNTGPHAGRFAANTTVYACWIADCNKITLNNTGNCTSCTGGTTVLYKLSGDTKWYSNSGCTTAVTAMTRPTLSGAYAYNGHFTTKTGTTNVITSAGALSTTWTVTAATTIYAQYTYTVTLNKNTSTSDTTTVATVRPSTGRAMPTTDTSGTALSVPTRSGYVFTGYFDARSGGTQYYSVSGTTISSTRAWDKAADTTLYAQWSQCSCSNGTGASSCSATVTNNQCNIVWSCNANYYGGVSANNVAAGTAFAATCKACPTNYPTRAGVTRTATAITDCYAERSPSCTQNNGTVPTNCAAVTAWNSCSCTTTKYRVYSNSAGTGDGTTSGTTSYTCTKSPSTVTAKANYYVDGTSCKACNTLGDGSYTTSTDKNTGGSGACYKSCTKACTQQDCPDNATCSYGSTTTSGTWAYGGSCNAADSTCSTTITCNAGYYKNNSTCTACPTGYTSAAGATAQSQCYTTCRAGTRVVSAGNTCTTPAGGWFTGEHRVYYGHISQVNYCMEPYANSSTTAANHDQAKDCSASIAAGYCVTASKMPVKYIRVSSEGSTANTGTHVIEIEAYESDDGTGTNLMHGKTGTSGSSLANATDGSWARSPYASGTMVWDLGSVVSLGSIKFAMYTDGRTYHNVRVDVSQDGNTWYTVFAAPNLLTENITAPTTTVPVGELIVLSGETQPCAAGKYIGAGTLALGSTRTGSNVTAGYYNTGCGTSSTGGVCSTSYSGGTISAGYYGAAGATSATGSGAVSAGYYSTGGGTSATPTAAGNGCISSKACGKVTCGYYSTGGGTSATPTQAGNGCISGKTCGKITAGYYGAAGATSATPNQCPANSYCPAGTCSTSIPACSSVSFTDTGTDTTTTSTTPAAPSCPNNSSRIANATATSQGFSRTCYRTTSAAKSTAASACTGSSNCGTKTYDTCYVTSCATGYSLNATSNATSCTANTYTISYTLNGGSRGTNHPTSGTYGTAFTVDNPTHSHATFAGWNITGMDSVTHTYGSSTTTATSISSTNATSFTNLRASSGTVTFKATWTCDTGYNGTSCGANTYTVKYDSNKPSTATGSISGSTADSSHTYGTAKALTTNGYTLTGWTFAGWNTKADGTGTSYADKASVSNLTTTNGGTVTLYAKWTQNCNAITMNNTARGGSTSNTTLYKKTDATAWYSNNTCTTAVTTTAAPAKTNAAFSGYYTASDNTTTSVGSSASPSALSTTWTVNAATTVYAHYNCNANYRQAGTDIAGACTNSIYTITLRNYNDSATDATIYEKYASGYSATNFGTTITSVSVPTRSGYTFRGYYSAKQTDLTATGGSGTRRITAAGALPGNTTFTANTTVYAAWAKNCTVPANGSCTLSVADNGTVTYTTSCNTGYTISGNGTATPTCTANCNAITLNANDGTAGSVTTLYKKTDATGWYSNNTCTTAYSTTTNVVPSRSGYTFRGFYSEDLTDVTSDNSSGTQYITTAGAISTRGTGWTVNAANTIYAAWAKNCTTPSNGSCSLSVSTAGAADYTTSCNTGYTISGNNTATPSCSANTNTITLNANGGTGGKIRNTAVSSSSQTVTFNCTTDSSISLPAWNATDSATTTSLTLSNKVFKGWSESASGSVVSVTKCPTGNKTYYAVWESASCTSGGTGVSSTTLKEVSGNAPVCNVTCSGNYSQNGGTNTTATFTATGTAGTAAYKPACKVKTSYTITIDKNGGTGTLTVNGTSQTGTTNVSVTCYHGNSVTLPAWNATASNGNNLTKSNSVFTGWDTTSPHTCTAAKTIKANWATGTCTAGTGVNTTSLDSISGNAPVCKRSSKAGYYCSATQTGTAGTASLTTTCTAASNGYYAAAGSTTQTACVIGSYSSASSASSTCTACPGGRTTRAAGTAYNATANTACAVACTAITNLATWKTPSWSSNSVSNLCTVDTCTACTKGTGAASCTYSTTGNVCTYSGTCSTGYSTPTASGTTISCTANTLTINLNKNGGTGTCGGATGTTAGSMSCTYDGTCTAPAWNSSTCNITNGTGTSSKVLTGWNTKSDGTGTAYALGASIKNIISSGSTTLYAVWGTPTCKVTDTNSASCAIATTSNNRPTATYTCKSGYHYGSNESTTSTTLYATAGQVSTAVSGTCTGNTITLAYANGGRGTAPTTPNSCTYGGSFTTPAAMTATGYTFSKWSVNSKTFNASTSVTCNSTNLGVTSGTATLTGTWTANTNTAYTVCHYTKNLGATSYTLNGGECESKTGTTGASLTLANLKKTITGFTYSEGFAGTATKGTTKPSSGAVTTTTVSAAGDRVIDLYYSRDTHTVTLTKGAGIKSVSGEGTYEYGATVTLGATMNDGYVWSKWTQTTGGTQISTTKAYSFTMGTSNITYTANASGVGYTIKFNNSTNATNGCKSPSTAGGTMSNQTMTYGTAANLTSNAFTCTGRYFMGWATTDGGSVVYTDGESVNNLTTTSGGTVNLYAVWQGQGFDGGKAFRNYNDTDNELLGRVGPAISCGSYTYPPVRYGSDMPTPVQFPAESCAAPVIPTRSGYMFLGLFDARSGGTKYYNADLTSAHIWDKVASPVLYAQWAPCITITLNNTGNGGTGGTTALYKFAGVAGWYSNSTCTTAVTALPTAPTKTGYTYNGHYTAATGGTRYITAAKALNTTWAPTAATTLYAQYSANTCTVTYKSGNTTLGTQNLTYGADTALTDVNTMSNVPVSSTNGWSFTGWSTETNVTRATYTNKQSGSGLCTTNGGNITLYGIWQRSVPFKYYNSATATSVTTSNQTQYYRNTSTTAASESSVSTYTLYTSTQASSAWTPLGWVSSTSVTKDTTASLAQTGAAVTVTPPAGSPSGTFYALYERTPAVAYNANSGTGTTSGTNCTDKQHIAAGGTANSSSCTLANNGFTTPKSGYTFYRWGTTTSATSGTAAGGSYTFPNTAWASNKTATLYAIWQTSITLNKNGGTGTIQGTSGTTNASKTCTYGIACDFGNTSTLSQSGYSFSGGWGTSSSCTAATTSFTSVTGTYYACKSANIYTSRLNKNGGTGTCGGVSGTSDGTQDCTFNAQCTLPVWDSRTCNLSKSGKVFIGWATSEADANAGRVVNNSFVYETASASTYYAVWVDPVCNITNGKATSSVKSETNTPSCAVTCTNGYSKTGYTDTTTTFTVNGTAGNPSIVATCAARTYKVTLDSKRYTSDTATSGTAATTSGTTEYWYRYNTHSPCYYYNVELTDSSKEVAANCIAGSGGVTITAPTLTGYTFNGYYTKKLGSGTQYVNGNGGTTNNIYSNVAANSTLYAKWDAKTYTVTYAAGTGGSGTITNGTATYNSNFTPATPSASTITKANATFAGWAVSGTSTVKVAGTAFAWTYTENKTFTATWTCNGGYYQDNNGVCTPVANGWWSPAGDNTRHECPTGYTGSDSDRDAQSDCFYGCPSKTVTNAKTVSVVNSKVYYNGTSYPTCTYNVTCNDGYTVASNGTASPACNANGIIIDWNENGGTAITNGRCTYDGDLVLAAAATRSGYTFVGWKTADGVIRDAGTTITGGCTSTYTGVTSGTSTGIVAQWCQNCNGTNANCQLTTSKTGTMCTYTTSCVAGYGTISNNGTYNPSCTKCDAGTYSANGNNTCSSCQGRTKYSGAGASSCSTVSSGYYTTGCDTNGDKCTGQSQCTGATYCSGGIQNDCPSGYTADTTAGKTANTQCKISVGAGKFIKTAKESSASGTCANWTWKAAHTVNYGSTSTCDGACPAVESGWTKGTGTGWGAVTSCYETQTPENCKSGSVQKKATSSTAWGTTITLVSKLTSNAGYYASTTATSCSICPAGNYCPEGATAATKCVAGSYQSDRGQSACIACAAGKTNSGTGNEACTTACTSIDHLATWKTPVWNSANNTMSTATCQVNTCDTCTKGTGVSSCSVSISNNTCVYTGTCAVGYSTKGGADTAGTTCSGYGCECKGKTYSCEAGKYLRASDATCQSCPAGKYCSGVTDVVFNGADQGISGNCKAGSYSTGGAKTSACTACTTTSGWTTTSAAGSTEYTACYQTQTPTNCASGTIRRNAKSISGTTITYDTATVTSALSASAGYRVNGTSCSICANGTFSGGGAVSSCTSCPALTSGYSYVSGTGWTSYSDCQETKSYSNVSTYCYSGSLTKTATSATAWGTAVSGLTAKAGSIISGSGDNTTCSRCTGATYQSTNGSRATSCTACPAAESGWTATTGTGWTSYSDCKETKSGSAISTYCKAGVLTKTASSATAWGDISITTALTAVAGARVNGQTCSQCTGATYQSTDGSTATSCTACPAQTSGWTRGTGTGWSNITSCYETKNATSVSSYCSAGVLRHNATSSGAWGSNTISTALQANAGSYVDGQTCKQCAAGTYTARAGTQTTCTTADSGYYVDTVGASSQTACPARTTLYKASDNGRDSINDCYATTSAGKWIATVNALTESACDVGYTCPGSQKVYYGDTGGRSACTNTIPSNSSYSGSSTTNSCAWSCNAGYYKNGSVCSECGIGYYCTGGTARVKCDTEFANTTTTTTTAQSSSACVCNAGYGMAGGTDNTCVSCIACARGTYKSSAGIAVCSAADDGYFVDTVGATSQTRCPTPTLYSKSNGDRDAQTTCYATTSVNKWIDVRATAESACTTGYTCPGSVIVQYGSAGGRNANTYNVTYACGDGATGTAPTTARATFDTAFTPAANACTKVGHTFAGWTVSGTSDVKAAGTAFTWTYSENKTLTATWTVNNYTCRAGTYLAAGATSCTTCPANSFCAGGTFAFNADNASGITACSTLAGGFYPNSAAGATASTACYTNSISGAYVIRNASSATVCANGTYKAAHTVNYGSSSTCTACTNKPANSTYTSGASANTCAWSCNAGYYGDSASGATSCEECGIGNFCPGGAYRLQCEIAFANTTTTTTTAKSVDECECATGFSATVTAPNTCAICTPNIVKVTLNDNSGTGGSGVVYEKYGVGYSLTNFGNTTTTVSVPTRTGYVFVGYYTAATNGTQMIPADGILPAATTFTTDTTLYAHWDVCAPVMWFNIDDRNTCPISWTNSNYDKAYRCDVDETTPVSTWCPAPGGDTTYTRDGYVLMGWKYKNGSDFSTYGCTADGTGVYPVQDFDGVVRVGESLSERGICGGGVNMHPIWCEPCKENIANGSCALSLNIGNDGVSYECKYSTSCARNYHYASGQNTANPVCIPNVVTIRLDSNGGTGGDDVVYESYADAYYKNYNASTGVVSTATTSIVRPTRTNYTFEGYKDGTTSIFNRDGNLASGIDATHFTANTTIIAQWQECKCKNGTNATNCTAVVDNNTCVRRATCPVGFITRVLDDGTVTCEPECNDAIKVDFVLNTDMCQAPQTDVNPAEMWLNWMRIYGNGTQLTGLYCAASKELEAGISPSNICAAPNSEHSYKRDGFILGAWEFALQNNGGTHDINAWKCPVNDNANSFIADGIMHIGESVYTTAYQAYGNRCPAQITLRPVWCPACENVEHGSCTFTGVIDNQCPAKCSYETKCDDGYHIASGSGTNHPICERDIITITLNKHGGTGGSDAVYEVLGVAYYSDENAQNATTSIIRPTRANYTFEGYKDGTTSIFSRDGNLASDIDATHFTANTTIDAEWKKCECTKGDDFVVDCTATVVDNECVIDTTCPDGTTPHVDASGNVTCDLCQNKWYLVLTPDMCPVTLNGAPTGSFGSSNLGDVSADNLLTQAFPAPDSANSFSRTGYDLVGWYLLLNNRGGKPIVTCPLENNYTSDDINFVKSETAKAILAVGDSVYGAIWTAGMCNTSIDMKPIWCKNTIANGEYVDATIDKDTMTYTCNYSCNPGYYMTTDEDGNPTCEPCAAGTYSPGGTATSCTVCWDNSYSDDAAAACLACDTVNGYTNYGRDASAHAGAESCTTRCLCGTAVLEPYGRCVPVGVDFWAADHAISYGKTSAQMGERHQCPVDANGKKTHSIGYGAGANDANDCGKIMHTTKADGTDWKYFLRKNRILPAGSTDDNGNPVKMMSVAYDGQLWHADLTTVENDHLRYGIDDKTYYLYAPQCEFPWNNSTDEDGEIDCDTTSYLSSNAWVVKMPWGNMYGISACSTTRPADGEHTIATDLGMGTESDDHHGSCWCMMTNPTYSQWVYLGDTGNGACSDTCQWACTRAVAESSTFRGWMLGSINAATGPQTDVASRTNGAYHHPTPGVDTIWHYGCQSGIPPILNQYP